MPQRSPNPAGFLTFTLHAHLPYVVNHGTWPHGMEWLHEAAAETYLPLLRMLRNLERDGIPFQCNLDLSPILLEQLAHPVFIAEFPRYLHRKITAAQEDEAFFLQSGETHYVDLARFWNRFFTEAIIDLNALKGSIIGGFRHFNDTGLISIITCAATHGYLPLLGTDESVRAQLRLAVSTHHRHFGQLPPGVWVPECGYRPAGSWSYPVNNADGTPIAPPFNRIGVEQALAESSLNFFFVDTHLVEEGRSVSSPYSASGSYVSGGDDPLQAAYDDRRLYHPHQVDGPYLDDADLPATSIFPRDPRTGIQVWSGDTGYPGDAAYLDFHKKRWPGGHRYWRVTGSQVDMADKQPYVPLAAAERVHEHAAHFAGVVWQALSPTFDHTRPPILCAPFDAELFGHWWFEGCLWLEAVARNLHYFNTDVQLTSCVQYLGQFPPTDHIAMHEGSWGASGGDQVWMNPETSWTWTHIYPAELFLRDLVTTGRWRDSALGTRIAQQLCREVLLLESSDWQFLITTGAARDYAEARFVTHNDDFNALRTMWEDFDRTGALTPEQQSHLDEICLRDGIFPDLDPSLWAVGAHASPDHAATPQPSSPAAY